jgi:hypothetical protein
MGMNFVETLSVDLRQVRHHENLPNQINLAFFGSIKTINVKSNN